MLQTKKRSLTPDALNALNKKYRLLTVEERIAELYNDFDAEEVMLTSSFATTSAFLLRVFSRVNAAQKIYFINTGYLFPETLVFRDEVAQECGLTIVDLKPNTFGFPKSSSPW